MGGNDVIIGGTVPQRIASCLNVMDSFLQQDIPVVSSLVLPSDTGSRAGGALSVAQKVGHILGVRDISKVNPASTLTEMGMDSLMSSEIKQVLEREKIVLTAEEIGKLSFSFLTDLS
jgi:fatty acid synthase